MAQTIKIADLTCSLEEGSEEKITYLIYPQIEGLSESFLKKMAESHASSVAVVYVPSGEWNNYLTPWPEPGEAKGFPPFSGEAGKFLKILTDEVIPQVETRMGIKHDAERNLIGVSLSGLFALWQWLQSGLFHSIACLSGSFWYAGFMDWFEAQTIPHKAGKAYFLLGTEEPKARIKAYRAVGANTLAVEERLRKARIDVKFEWVPGNHFSDPVHRLELGFTNI